MINLRQMKRELEDLIEKRENTEIYDSDEDYTNLCDQIEGYYRDIAEVILYNETILETVQQILNNQDRRSYFNDDADTDSIDP